MSEGNDFAEMLGRIDSSMKHVIDRLQKLEDHQKKTHGEEHEEWVDLDKIEKNKDYTKFIEEIKGKVDLMQRTLRKNQGFNDYLFSMGGIATEPSIQPFRNFPSLKLKNTMGVLIPNNTLDNT
jgi:hypothetical protein|uniref:Uncharacterized protein n=1 Tax=Fagus sylvatica TaxID=28930 RepID=A0A2N9GQA4_FAGSY